MLRRGGQAQHRFGFGSWRELVAVLLSISVKGITKQVRLQKEGTRVGVDKSDIGVGDDCGTSAGLFNGSKGCKGERNEMSYRREFIPISLPSLIHLSLTYNDRM